MDPSDFKRLLRVTPRLAQIGQVLAHRGFISALLARERLPPPEEVRAVFEELGTVFIKFGQVLAVRRDLLPDEYVIELERLHDRLLPVSFPTVRNSVENELGAPLTELFASFTEEPLASASIAQVHQATLPDGRQVAVKVRRPDLEAIISHDIKALYYLASLVENVTPHYRSLNLIATVREFDETLHREIDFTNEARSITRFREALAGVPGIWIPNVITEFSSGAVLTTEFSPGERIDHYAAAYPDAARKLADRIAILMIRSIFEQGLFHADPHPGNVFVLPDGRLCLHDFGMTGELNEELRDKLVRLLEAVAVDDAQAATDAYLELGTAGGGVDRAALEGDIKAVLNQIRDRSLSEISVGSVFESLLRTGARHKIRNPGSFLLLVRAFLISEALMRQLDPKLNPIRSFQDELSRLALQRYTPKHLFKEGLKLAAEIERFSHEVPADVRRAFKRLADGELGKIYAPEVESLERRMSRDAERLTGAVASAALVVGGSLLVLVGDWHRWFGDALIVVGVVGTFAVAFGALWKPRA